ncbi:hypothetical protein QUF63_17355 [Anaerolineales bacterium HSG25]|nr:hypothetical protein [Anaerolineales bacterium HSG25]
MKLGAQASSLRQARSLRSQLTTMTEPTKEVDIDFLVFIERYASDLLKWDILTFFATHPDQAYSTEQIAQHVGRNSQSVRPDLGDLTLSGILEQGTADKVTYKLTESPRFRNIVLKLPTHKNG